MIIVEQHGHVWTPVSGWIGRYRCLVCCALGYRVGSTHGFGAAEDIRPYKCGYRKGEQCTANAVSKTRKGFRCTVHIAA